MKTIQVILYGFEELTANGRDNAFKNYAYYNLEDDWWRNVYEDAERIFLKITGFDIDRGNYCSGEWLIDAERSAREILKDHGERTPTYQIAQLFLAGSDPSEGKEEQFLSLLLKEYRELLRQEYEYLASEEAISDAFKGNERLFTADGKLADRLEKLAII